MTPNKYFGNVGFHYVKPIYNKEILTQESNPFQVPLVQKAIEQFLEEENYE